MNQISIDKPNRYLIGLLRPLSNRPHSIRIQDAGKSVECQMVDCYTKAIKTTVCEQPQKKFRHRHCYMCDII